MSGVSQRSFASGEITPALYARTDTARFQNSLKIMRNAFVLRHGGSANRPGTAFCGEAKDSTKKIRLIPFIFSNSVTYTLEFGNLYMRVVKNGQHVRKTGQAITGITNANPAVLSYTGSDNFVNGEEVHLSQIVGAIGLYLNGRNFKVAGVNTGANTFQLQYMDGTPVNSTSFGSYTSGGLAEEIFEIATPYVEADLFRLKFAQSADVMTFTHRNYAPRELSRTGDAAWTLLPLEIRPNIATAIDNISITGSGGTVTFYKITATNIEGDESLPLGAGIGSSVTPAGGTPVTLSWSVKSPASPPFGWNVYKSTTGELGTYGFIATLDSNGGGGLLVDAGIPADLTTNPPVDTTYFSGSGNYPANVELAQQRKIFSSSLNEPETVWASKTGSYRNFYKIIPIADDSPIKFSLAGNRVTEIRNLIDLGSLFMLTDSSEFQLEGDQGIITPYAVGPKSIGANGSSYLAPLKIGNTALFVQALGAAVMDLNFDYQTDGYRGNEVSLYASHLVDNFEIVDWAYQKIPHSIAWMVRDDGSMIALTYNREQQIFGWSRHDFAGAQVESVCSIPEGKEYAVYVALKRTVDGRTVRYIERMATRTISTLPDAKFMDAHVTYDGRNTGVTTMTLSGGTTWSHEELLTLTASASTFAATDIGNQIHLKNAAGKTIRFTIDGFTSSTVVTGYANVEVIADLRNTARSTWAKAVKQVTGLWHLEGKDVAILGDGFVVASPNNPDHQTITVTGGKIDLPQAYGVMHIGLPYVADLGTLAIDTPQGESMADRKTLINKVTVHIHETCGLWFSAKGLPSHDGIDNNMTELKPETKRELGEPLVLESAKRTINTSADWEHQGEVCIRQIDPLPMSILSIAPAGFIPLPRGS